LTVTLGSKDNKTRRQHHQLPASSRIGLTARITVVYYLALLGLVWLTIASDAPLAGGEGPPASRLWLKIIVFYFYVLPPVLAVILGIIFRPFWPNFRNFLVTVFVIHGLYSFGISVIRHQYLMQRLAEFDAGPSSEIQLKSLRHELTDKYGDGVLNQLDIFAEIDLSQLQPGRYSLKAALVKGNAPVAHGDLAAPAFDVAAGASGNLSFHFVSDFAAVNPSYQEMVLNVDFQLMKEFTADHQWERILAFSRWAPFFRETGWDGSDLQFGNTFRRIAEWVSADKIVYQPYGQAGAPIEFARFADDFGRDEDKDGFFDYLVITLDVSSHYAGPLYVQAYLATALYPLYFPTQVEKGLQTIEYVVGGDYLYELAGDGPYHFEDFEISNEDPGCQDKDCRSKPRVPFRVNIETPYKTKQYSKDQFEAPRIGTE
jgi:hypothetical protein